MKLWKATFIAFLCLAACFGGQLNAPHPGFARYQDGFIASIFGLPGNFIVHRSAIAPADAASFSDQGGLLARNGHIVLVKADSSVAGEFDSGVTAPVLSITGDASTALVWASDQHAISNWTGTNFRSIEIDDPLPPGIVTSIISSGPAQASLLIAQANGAVSRCSVSLATGSVASCDLLPGVKGPAFEQAGYLIFKDDQGLEIQDQTGKMRTFALTAKDLQFQRMSSDWVHIYSADTQQHWALHLAGAESNLSQLPAVHPVEEGAK